MHGRVKVRSSEEQQLAKRKEQAKKLTVFQNVMSKIFAKRASGQQDHEQLEITASVLQMNPDVYTLWNIRKEVLGKFKAELSSEDFDSLLIEDLTLTQRCLTINPKSYGVWHHRTWVLNSMSNPKWDAEIKLCNEALKLDERNFHCWDFRRFVASKSNVSNEDELKFSTEKVCGNFSNYSAWHYRSELLPRVHPSEVASRPDPAMVKRELQLVQNAMFTDPNDQSAFFYHRWLLGRKEPALNLCRLQASVINDNLRVAVSTTLPCQSGAILVTVEGAPASWKWSSPAGNFSDIWVSTQPDFENPRSISVTIGESTLTFLASRDMETVNHISENFNVSRLVEVDVDKETLENELDSLQQLKEMEPDNKWVLLTYALLLRATKQNVDDTVFDVLQKLREIDPNRRSYYDDLRSNMLLDDHLFGTAEFSYLDCKDLDLTTVARIPYLAFIQKIDLSGSQLNNMTFAKYLVCTKSLNLSNNLIEEVTDVSDALEELDVSNNRIKAIHPTVLKLKVLKVDGNPVA